MMYRLNRQVAGHTGNDNCRDSKLLVRGLRGGNVEGGNGL